MHANPPNSFPLFPFPQIRDGQRQLMEAVQKTVKNKKILLANAPTGIGKTAGVLAPALEYALENGLTILFLTPRHSQHKIVVDTLREIKKKSGKTIQATDLIGKRWLCNLEAAQDMQQSDFEAHCASIKKEGTCPYHNNTYSKVGALSENALKMLSKLESEIMHAEEAKKACKGLCPADIIFESAKAANVIIADYHHIFHPSVRDVFLAKTGKSLENCIIIVDEAHNAPARIRGLLSAQLSTFQLERAINEAEEFGNKMLADDLELSKRTLRRDFEKMLSQDLVERVGERNQTFYQLKPVRETSVI